MNNYCPNCGNKTQGVSINFCPKCGQNLKKLTIDNKSEKEEMQMSSSTDGYLDISKLKEGIKVTCDIEKSGPITIGEYLSAARRSGQEPPETISRPKPKLPNSKKEMLNLIKDECAPSRGKSAEVD